MMANVSGMPAGEARTSTRSPIRTAAMVTGAIFLLIGILGFIPGITTDYGEMGFAGHNSDAMLLGIFQVSILHNVVHLLLGIAGLAMARSAAGAYTFLIGAGVIYLLLWIYGLIVSDETTANFVPLNTADDWLHLVLGVGVIALGVLLRRSGSTSR